MRQRVRVELVWQRPSAQLNEVRSALGQALQLSGLPPFWQEWRRDDSLLPSYLKQKSPLILYVNGGLATDFSDYSGNVADLQAVIQKCAGRPFDFKAREPLRRRLNPSALAALGLILVPKCPLCWAAYMSAASAMGIGSLSYKPWLLPAMVVLMGIPVVSMVYRRRHGYGPALLALCSATLVVAGKLSFDSAFLMYFGLLILIAATVWNALPRREKLRKG